MSDSEADYQICVKCHERLAMKGEEICSPCFHQGTRKAIRKATRHAKLALRKAQRTHVQSILLESSMNSAQFIFEKANRLQSNAVRRISALGVSQFVASTTMPSKTTEEFVAHFERQTRSAAAAAAPPAPMAVN